MRKNKAESTEPQAIPAAAPSSPKTKMSERNWRPIILVAAILFLAAFVRVAFSFGVSAGSDFALSGGTEASNNLRFVESIVNDGKIRFTDNYLNYPNSTLIVVPIFFDLVMAGLGMFLHLFISSGTEASSLALALSGPVFGVLACIPMYFVGREMFSSKTAGYLSALFLALCPVFVQESVFSNGVGTSFALFFFLIGVYFLIRAIKDVKEFGKDLKTPLIAGAFIAISMMSTLFIRDVAIPLVIVMIAQVIIDRLKGKDPRANALIYIEVIAVGFGLPCIAYTAAGYWDALVSGVACILVLSIGFTAAFGWTHKKPWLLTLPVCAIVFLAVMLVLAVVTPHLYGCLVGGNTVYDSAYLASLGRQYLTLSQLGAYYGYLTYWLVFVVCLYMAYRFLRNASSALYTFTLVWLFTMTLTLGHNSAQAAFAAPVFALGFAAVCKTILAHVDFKAYFSGIRTGAGSKTKIRRIISPIPLMSILVAVFLVAAPNMMQVIDAGISSNDAKDYNEKISNVTGSDQFGTLSYYVKTDSTWNVRAALSDGSVSGKGGAYVTWLSYSDDVKIYGDSKSFTDMYGNGSAAASNILLANAVDGSSSAALLITAIMSKGMTSDVKTALSSSGFSADEISVIENVLADTGYTVPGTGKSARELVTTDYEKYGSVSSGISDENVKYLFLSDYIAEKHHSYDITSAYDKLGLRSPYIMVTGDMMPFFYGYSSIFDEMALLNGYNVDSTYGTVSKFTSFGYYAYYYGVYTFTDEMYDTLLYRTYVGMTPEEAGYDSIYSYLGALSAADASVQMHPGYGLSNYEVAYWHVMYNSNSNATSSSDGWKEMDAQEAIALQKTDGGVINYVSGLPVILRYVANTSGHLVSGTVKDASSAGVAGVRVSAVDAQGVVHAMTHTSADGSFKLFVSDVAGTTLVYHLGSDMASSGGVVIGTQPASSPNLSGVQTTATVGISITHGGTPVNLVSGGKMDFDLTIENTANGNKLSFAKGSSHDATFQLGLGNYKFTVKDGDTEVATTTLNVNAGTTNVGIAVSAYTYKVTVKDQYGALLSGTDVTLDGMVNMTVPTDASGVATFDNVPAGTYTLGVAGKYVEDSSVSISSNTSKTVTAEEKVTFTVTTPASGLTVFVVGDAFSTSVLATTTSTDIQLPRSSISSTQYTMYAFYNGSIYHAVADASSASVTLSAADLSTVTGTLKDSDGNAVAGTVTFASAGGEKYTFRASSADDGKGTYKAYVPAGTYTVYATDSTDAYFGSATFAAGSSTQDITMSDADKVSVSGLSWSSVYYSYVMVKATINGSFDMSLMTSDGTCAFYLPRGMGASITTTVDTPFVNPDQMTVDSGHTAAVSKNFTLKTNLTEVHVTNDVDPSLDSVDLKIGKDTYTVSGWNTAHGINITSSGSVSVVLGKSTSNVYHSGTCIVPPGATVRLSHLIGSSDLDSVKADTITVSDYSSDYTIKVYTDLAEDKYTTVTSASPTRLSAPVGGSYCVLITKADSTKIYCNSFPAGTDINVAIADCVDAVHVTGYIGANVNTKITFAESGVSGRTQTVTVSNGSYDAVLKKGQGYDIKIDDTVSGVKYRYSETSKVFNDSGTYNIVTTSGPLAIYVDLSAPSAITMTGKTAKVSFTIPAGEITNTTENIDRFTITAGSGWDTFTVSDVNGIIDGFTLAPGASNGALTVTGYFNTAMYRLGTSALSVSISGTTDKAVVCFYGYDGDSGLVYVNKAADIEGDHVYEYTYTFINMGSKIVDVNVDLSGTPAHDGWYLYFKSVNAIGTAVAPASSTISLVPGTTTFSIMLMPESTSTSVPDVNVTFSATGGLVTTTDDKITIQDGKATSAAAHEDAEVSVYDMSASGRGVVNDKGSVPTVVWVMAAIMALLLILIFWMSSKRGVFARRK